MNSGVTRFFIIITIIIISVCLVLVTLGELRSVSLQDNESIGIPSEFILQPFRNIRFMFQDLLSQDFTRVMIIVFIILFPLALVYILARILILQIMHLVPATECPRCGGPIIRVHRRPGDRLFKNLLLVRIARYRCDNLNCGWEGLRKPRKNY